MGEVERFDLSFHAQDDSDSSKLNTAQWKTILANHPEIEFVWLQFMLFEGTTRMRMIPAAYFTSMMQKNRNISLSSAYLHALRNDDIAPGAASTGEMYLAPDISTASMNSNESSRVRILANMVNQDQTPRPECIRSKLSNLSDILSHLHGFYLLIGYEIEVVFFRREDNEGAEPFVNHKCSAMTFEMRSLLPMIENIVRGFHEEQVPLEQYHSELAPGQWEFVLAPQQPLKAVDTLVRAREIISRSTGIVQPYILDLFLIIVAREPMSIFPSTLLTHYRPPEAQFSDPFFAGIIDHLPSLMAFCLPLDASYGRLATGIWSGGEFVSWGWQNKETALRRITNNRFELKIHCGMANPYISLAAIMAAGLDGLRKSLPLVAGDCQVSPAELSEEQRSQLGIKPLPRDMQQSMKCLAQDNDLQRVLGEKYTATYLDVVREWNKQVDEMDETARRITLLQNY
ncbi:glutamine synthetase/guanido kinase [Penicillium brevicompactum]|uniref:glutamine synthetase/guanido kinase n=1 Tax=Penicillium brevicompactum TaxID=5074 RepID=UPI0025400AF2|nr:glutamine synthetase/guanido kinase [Penicillium brevicompactum]KAJ5336294.1 glutamine synthetase/guanido kinase [Penicillium brevicompactum]